MKLKIKKFSYLAVKKIRSVYLLFLVLWDCGIHKLLGVGLNPGLDNVRDVASAIISHEQTQ